MHVVDRSPLSHVGQGMHAVFVCAVASIYWPSSHAVQTVSFEALHAVSCLFPASHVLQSWQFVCPDSGWYCPVGHAWQSVSCVALPPRTWKVPALHTAHVEHDVSEWLLSLRN